MKKVRWGLIGCGDIARKRVAPALRDLPNGEFVAASRAQAAAAEGFAREFGARKWHQGWQALLQDAEIDAVYIATPVFLHEAMTVAAAQAGKHVLCEKPMALNLAACDKMIAACRANHVKLGIAYYRHFYPAIIRIKELIAAGEIGEVVYVQMNAFEYFNPQPGEPRYWFLEKDKAGGGPMFDFGCHRIEVLLHLFGEVESVQGFVSNMLFEREVEDTATAFFRFAAGPHAVLHVTHAAFEPQDTLAIFGSKGSIHAPVLNSGGIIIKTANTARIVSYPPFSNFHQPLIANFTNAVLEDREPAVDGTIGREVNRLLMRIYEEL